MPGLSRCSLGHFLFLTGIFMQAEYIHLVNGSSGNQIREVGWTHRIDGRPTIGHTGIKIEGEV